MEAAARQHRDTDDVRLKNENVGNRRVVAGEVDPRAVPGGETEDRRLVDARHYQFHIVPSSSRATGS